MEKYTFTGRILPERANVSLGSVTIPNFFTKEAVLKGNITISIKISQIIAQVEITHGVVDIFTLKNSIEFVVRNIVDAFGYVTGRGYDIEITSGIDSVGNQTIFGVGVDTLEDSASERPFTYEQVLQLTTKSLHLRRALSDLREAIRSPFDTHFFCYRVLEDVRQHFHLDGEEPKKSWSQLKDSLRIERSYIIEFESIATGQRHGEIASSSADP
jgi:hypothetical protein